MARQREIVGTFLGEKIAFENGETRTIIGLISPQDGGAEITIKGEGAAGEFKPGIEYRFYGHNVNHWKHGEQFSFASYVVQEPATAEGVVAYLQQCEGIGPSTAWAMWERFGAKAVETLRTDPVAVAAEIHRFSLEKARKASDFLSAFASVEQSKIEVIGLLNGRGFPKKTVDRVIQKWGSAAAAVIRRDPHYLMRFRGCGFLGTDKMYCEIGRPPGRLKRQALCAWYAIARDRDGHTWFPLHQAHHAIRASIAGADPMPERATELAVRSEYLSVKEEAGVSWIAEGKKARSEERLARYLDDARREFLDAMDRVSWPSVDQVEGTSEHQTDELTKALQGFVCILGGSPGTGKTHTAGALIRLIVELYGIQCIAACCPTGKAAVRLTESLLSHGVQLQATTIHRLLKIESSDDGGWSFLYNERNPLPHRFVLIDESSMIDTDLAASLLAARAPGTCYLFLGDVNQLAPVGHGAPLRDMIAAGIPYGELREIRRNSGRIVQACAEIRDNRRFSVSEKFDIEAGENLMIMQRRGPEMQIEALTNYLNKLRSIGTNPTWDVQVLTAMNKKSRVARKPLNTFLQGLLNPDGERVSGNPFRLGDKVINLKNGWFPSLDESHPEANSDGKVFVANGELAEVKEITPARTVVALQSPDRVVVIPHGQKEEAAGDADSKDDETAAEDAGSAGSWDLGYAISTHKSQGSEWPVVVVILDEAARRMMTRNWLYTAISRAKKMCLLIGPKSLADEACRKDGLRRKTLLVERLRDLANPPVHLSDEEIDDLFAGAADECEELQEAY